jgi:hypothetical protein
MSIVDWSGWNKANPSGYSTETMRDNTHSVMIRDQLIITLYKIDPQVGQKMDEACAGVGGRSRHAREISFLQRFQEAL